MFLSVFDHVQSRRRPVLVPYYGANGCGWPGSWIYFAPRHFRPTGCGASFAWLTSPSPALATPRTAPQFWAWLDFCPTPMRPKRADTVLEANKATKQLSPPDLPVLQFDPAKRSDL